MDIAIKILLPAARSLDKYTSAEDALRIAFGHLGQPGGRAGDESQILDRYAQDGSNRNITASPGLLQTLSLREILQRGTLSSFVAGWSAYTGHWPETTFEEVGNAAPSG